MIQPLAAWGFLVLFTLLAFYFMLGYPLLLWKWPFSVQLVRKNMGFLAPVTILMAVHNGAEFLRDKLDSLLALDYPTDQLEIFVLSDGSSDNTERIAREYADRGIQLVSLPRGGKAEALNQGLKLARGEILFFTDVRQRLDKLALRHLVANFSDPEVGGVTGELQILQPGDGEQAAMDLYWRYELWARSKQSGHYSLFNTTGCLYAMRRKLAHSIRPQTLIDDAELPLQAYMAGYRIVFDPASLAYDYPTAQGTEWARRMRTLGGMWQVFCWHPQLLLRPHKMWIHFVSHKFGRLLLPWLFVGIVISTVLLPESSFKQLLLSNELVLAVLALANPWLNKMPVLGKFSSLARTFLVMNLASILSIKVLFSDPRRMWGTTRVDMNSGDTESKTFQEHG